VIIFITIPLFSRFSRFFFMSVNTGATQCSSTQCSSSKGTLKRRERFSQKKFMISPGFFRRVCKMQVQLKVAAAKAGKPAALVTQAEDDSSEDQPVSVGDPADMEGLD
jgi:hypothetical protein